jgi:hypothetical protein
VRVESSGSFWEIDEDLMRYRRWPKSEKPREDPDWGDENAGALQDIVWHTYVSWRIRDLEDIATLPWRAPELLIFVDENDPHACVNAPHAYVVGAR